MEEFQKNNLAMQHLIKEWEIKLIKIPLDVLSNKKNAQNRTIKQIVGHLIDSATNNVHRIVLMQYGENPLHYQNYSINGNNDRWINIQNYQFENWNN